MPYELTTLSAHQAIYELVGKATLRTFWNTMVLSSANAILYEMKQIWPIKKFNSSSKLMTRVENPVFHFSTDASTLSTTAWGNWERWRLNSKTRISVFWGPYDCYFHYSCVQPRRTFTANVNHHPVSKLLIICLKPGLWWLLPLVDLCPLRLRTW